MPPHAAAAAHYHVRYIHATCSRLLAFFRGREGAERVSVAAVFIGFVKCVCKSFFRYGYSSMKIVRRCLGVGFSLDAVRIY